MSTMPPENENKAGIVYILTNTALDGYVKIGKTQRTIEERLKDLNNPSIPRSFEIHDACEVDDVDLAEKTIHKIFHSHRDSDHPQSRGREFFLIEPEKAAFALQLIRIGHQRDIEPESVTYDEEEQKEIAEIKERRSNFDFKTYGIKVGTELEFSQNSKNDKPTKAIVIEGNKIEWHGEETSVSKSAQDLLGRKNSVQGTLYWMYENETLDERRRRMDKEKTESSDD